MSAEGNSLANDREQNLAIVTRAQDRVRQTGEALTSEQILELPVRTLRFASLGCATRCRRTTRGTSPSPSASRFPSSRSIVG